MERFRVYSYEEGVLIAKKYNLIGQRFGSLVVLEEVSSSKLPNQKKCVQWKCLCDCGNEHIVKTENLISGKTFRCSKCANASIGEKKHLDLTGRKFGELTVTKMLYNYKNKGKTFCECFCSCGNIVVKNAYRISHSSQFVSCGCKRKDAMIYYHSDDITGQKYNRLIVLETLYQESPIKVRCRCDCGNEITVAKADVLSGHTQSCGCFQAEQISKANYKDLTGYISEYGVKAIIPKYQNKHGVWIWEFECPLCGHHFDALPANVKSNETVCCGCASSSTGELIVKHILDDNNIDYRFQYGFSDCKYKKMLLFDFAVFANNNELQFLIEYDGKQHYESIEYFGGMEAFKKLQIRDEIKNNYCKEHNIKLVRLKYDLTEDEIKNIIINTIYPERLPLGA